MRIIASLAGAWVFAAAAGAPLAVETAPQQERLHVMRTRLNDICPLLLAANMLR